MLKEMIQAFDADKIESVQTGNAAGVPAMCPNCGGKHFWELKARPEFYCSKCKPIPNRSFVADEYLTGKRIELQPLAKSSNEDSGPVVLVCRYYLNIGFVCKRCFGTTSIESTFSDGSCVVDCWSCSTSTGRFSQGRRRA